MSEQTISYCFNLCTLSGLCHLSSFSSVQGILFSSELFIHLRKNKYFWFCIITSLIIITFSKTTTGFGPRRRTICFTVCCDNKLLCSRLQAQICVMSYHRRYDFCKLEPSHIGRFFWMWFQSQFLQMCLSTATEATQINLKYIVME